MRNEEWLIDICVLVEEDLCVIESEEVTDLGAIDETWQNLVKKYIGEAVEDEDLELADMGYGFFLYRFKDADDIWLRCEVHLERIPF